MTASVIVITGVMAAGKSTVAELVAQRLPRSAHVRGDAFRRMIVSGRAEMTPEQSDEATRQLHLRYAMSAAIADGYAQHGFTAVVQDVIIGPDLQLYVDYIATRPCHVVVLAPSPDIVELREHGRGKSGYGDWTVAALDKALRNDTPRLGLWLDTSTQTPEQTADEVLARLSESMI
jgi:chloramphenicol 3-O-phosphotransferase